ncbi:MAG: 2-hydroxychromene-2-carboxylate isomerase [Gammaproteobacteria bacterium]|nr:2-hydroxychromene-2-carboxylate isomerase [Gammaproteobacteria bacterium]
MRVEFWFEFASTYSYPAAMHIEALAGERGVDVVWRPFMLGPIFKVQGWNDSPFNLYPAKGRYMWRDIERICAKVDVPYNRPTTFPRNGLLAARVACRFANAPWVADFVRAIYRANFEQDCDISTRETVARCLAGSGESAVTVLEEAQSPESKALLRRQTEEALRLGIFGAPSFVVSGELFWGSDRIEDALSWAVEGGVMASSR